MPATFGQMLTAAREKRGLSIEDAAHETRIPAQRLRYLESGNVAAFGSMTYARSFIRQYSEYLGVDASSMLEGLPEGVLGGERDYRYLTQSQGPWLREREKPAERVTAPAVNRVRSIKSPLPAGIAVFVVVLAGTAMWGSHVAAMRNKVVPAALKALPVEDDEPETEGGTKDGITDLKARHVSLPVRKADPVN
jgi:cytoskeletal protein RodZ